MATGARNSDIASRIKALGASPVHPDLDAAMKGRGGKRPVLKKKKRKKRLTDAEKMDLGLPL